MRNTTGPRPAAFISDFAFGLLLAGALLAARPGNAADALAEETAWAVIEVSGDVVVRPSSDTEAIGSVQPGTRLATPFRVETGVDGALTLARGADIVEMDADTTLEFPEALSGGVTEIIEHIGEAFFSVETRPARTFQVRSAYMVTLVKGTAFTVSVSDAGATVDVSDGVVEVSSPSSNERLDVAAGQAARIAATSGASISVGKSRAKARPKREVVVPPAPEEKPALPAKADRRARNGNNGIGRGGGRDNGNSKGNAGGAGSSKGEGTGNGNNNGKGNSDGKGNGKGNGKGKGNGNGKK